MSDEKGSTDFSDNGWLGLMPEWQEAQRAKNAGMTEAQRELAKAYRRLFSTPEGALVLADLKRRTVDQPTWVPSEVNPIHAGFAREGQNSMFRHIVSMMAAAEATKEDTNG